MTEKFFRLLGGPSVLWPWSAEMRRQALHPAQKRDDSYVAFSQLSFCSLSILWPSAARIAFIAKKCFF